MRLGWSGPECATAAPAMAAGASMGAGSLLAGTPADGRGAPRAPPARVRAEQPGWHGPAGRWPVPVRRCRSGAGPSAASSLSRSASGIWGAFRGASRHARHSGGPELRAAPERPVPGPSRSIGASALRTSSGSVTMVAPDLMRALVPSARGSRGWPGMANTSRPCSPAMRAVMRVPDRRAASTISTPSASPEMMRLRRGKSWARGTKPGGFSVTRQPRSPICALQAGVLRWINIVDAARQHGHGSRRQGRIVGCRVDPAGEAGGDHEPGRAEMRGEQARELLACRRAVACADDGDHRPGQVTGIALHVEQRRGCIDGRQRRRIAGLDREQRPGADLAGGLQLRLGNARARRCAAPARRPPLRDSSGSASSACSAPPK